MNVVPTNLVNIAFNRQAHCWQGNTLLYNPGLCVWMTDSYQYIHGERVSHATLGRLSGDIEHVTSKTHSPLTLCITANSLSPSYTFCTHIFC